MRRNEDLKKVIHLRVSEEDKKLLYKASLIEDREQCWLIREAFRQKYGSLTKRYKD